MTKYYNHIHRNFTNLLPDIACAVWHYDGVDRGYNDVDALIDNEVTAREFFGLFNSISLKLDVLNDDVVDLIRSSLLALIELQPDWLDATWCWHNVREWIGDCPIYSNARRLMAKSSTTALRRLLMLSLLLSDDRDMCQSRPWVFLYRYGIPFEVADCINEMCHHKVHFDEYVWNKFHHAASVGLRCLIDSYALIQTGLLHDVDKTDGDGEMHEYHIAGHHNLVDGYTLPRFVEAAHDAAETTLAKGWPCYMQDVDGMETAVEDSLLLRSDTPLCPEEDAQFEFMPRESHRDAIDVVERLSHTGYFYNAHRFYSELRARFILSK